MSCVKLIDYKVARQANSATAGEHCRVNSCITLREFDPRNEWAKRPCVCVLAFVHPDGTRTAQGRSVELARERVPIMHEKGVFRVLKRVGVSDSQAFWPVDK